MTNEDSACWETDAVTGVTCLSIESWTALVARKSDGWHYLVHMSGDMRICPLADMRKGPPFDIEG